MIDNYILYNNIPTIDLHGNDRYSAVLYTKEFIRYYFFKEKELNGFYG